MTEHLHFDGWCQGSNPSTSGGATVVRASDKKMWEKRFKAERITNNMMELEAGVLAAEVAEEGDLLVTDSKVVVHYATNPKTRRRSKHPQLLRPGTKLAELLVEKNLTLEWRPREGNLAGIHNEGFEVDAVWQKYKRKCSNCGHVL